MAPNHYPNRDSFLHLGLYPTPVEYAAKLSSPSCRLWVKRDDLCHPVYGGNKVRKLEYLLAKALHKKAKRIVTFGAAGSHHVLATAYHAQRLGIKVAAILTPQPDSDHGRSNLRAALACGLDVYPCTVTSLAPLRLAKIVRPGDFIIPPGASNVTGALGYAAAAVELADQCSNPHGDTLPVFDVIVVALGSGSTAAGLVAGLELTCLPCRLHAVRVVPASWSNKAYCLALAAATVRRLQPSPSLRSMAARLHVVGDRLGSGYAMPTPWGSAAEKQAARAGLHVEATYTAKALSHALRLAAHGPYRNVLYWHTLSHNALHRQLAADNPCHTTTPLPQDLKRLFVPRTLDASG